jgi:hypothetical protein
MAKYPLEPLSRVRMKKVDDAARALADAVQARLDAAAKAEHASLARKEHDARADATRSAERSALENGALTVADLARADAWEARAVAETTALVRGEADARATEATTLGGESVARDGVAARKADASVVDKHHERWRAEIAKARDAKEEEEMSEAWRPKGEP